MSEISRPGPASKYAQRYDKVVKNDGSEEIPPWAVMQIASASLANQDEIYTVVRPNGASKAKHILNGPQTIVAGGYGSGTDSFPAVAGWDGNTLNPPTPPQEWGPVNGSWFLSIDGKGFFILGGEGNRLVRVYAASGADFPLIKIKNDSGTFRATRSVVGIGQPVDPPPATLNSQPTFLSDLPGTGGVFAVLMDPCDPGNIVDAAPIGIVACKVNYRGYFNGETHNCAEADEGDYGKLVSVKSGRARILWREKQAVMGAGTDGTQWAFVLIDASAGGGGGGGLRYVKIVGTSNLSPAIEGALASSDSLSPVSASFAEYIRDSGGGLNLGAPIGFENVSPDPIWVADGGFRVGLIEQDHVDSERWVLIQVSCVQIEDV
jgi:hypothetical protein